MPRNQTHSPLARWLGRAGTLEEAPRWLCAAAENYHRTCLVTHYPQDFEKGALAALVRLGFPVRAVECLAPAEFEFNRWAQAKLTRLEATIEERESKPGGVVPESEIGAAQALRHFRKQSIVGDSWLLVTVSAPDEATLDERARQAQKALRKMGCAVTWLGKEQQPGFDAGFIAGDPAQIRRTHEGWLVDPHAVAQALHPAVAGTLDDGRGIYVGHRTEDGARTAFALAEGVHNRNVIILGASGEGKSTLLKAVTVGLLAEGWLVVVFDVDGEYRPLCEMVGGAWIDHSAGSGRYYDPLVILPPCGDPEVDMQRIEDALNGAVMVLLLLAGDADAEERAAADRAVMAAVEAAGIDRDNPATWDRPTGGLPAAYRMLQQEAGADPGAHRLAKKLWPYFEGTQRRLLTQADDAPDAQAPLIVIHFGPARRKGAEAHAQAVKMALATHYCWGLIRRERALGRRPVAINFEEGQRLLQDEDMSDFVLDIATGIRKFNGICILAMNEPKVLFGTAGGQGLWDNSAVKVLFWMEEAALKDIAQNTKVPQPVLDTVAALQGSHAFAVRYAEKGWDVLRLQLPPEEVALYKTRGFEA